MTGRKSAKAAPAAAAAKPGKASVLAKSIGSVPAVVRSLSIEYRDPAELLPYARNARTHSNEQLRQIGKAMREFGWTNPILVDEEGGIVAGHGRIEAARLLWDKQVRIEGAPGGMVPCIVIPGLTPERRAALALADNRIALNAGWNKELLAAELRVLADAGWALTDLGFNPDEVADLLVTLDETHGDPEAAPPAPAPEAVVCREGDVWLLGPHRLVCGDSTVPAVVQQAFGEHRPRLMVTDPPYGVEYDPAWRQRAGIGSAGAALGKITNDDRADWREAWALFPGAVAYVWHGGLHAATVAASLEACGLMVRAQIVWVKTRPAISRGDYHWQHEPALYAVAEGEEDGWQGARFEADHEVAGYAVRKGRPGHWRGGRKQSTVWHIEHVKSETGHGSQKPTEAMRRPMENNSAPGDVVYDPFLGSGTTLIAAVQCGRICVGVELSPAYCDVIIRRWQEFVSRRAVLEADGRIFTEVEQERLAAGNGEAGATGAAPDGASREGRRRTAQAGEGGRGAGRVGRGGATEG